MVNRVKLYNNFNTEKNHKNSIILIGNFDGLHLGHQKLFRTAKNYKKKYSSRIGVLTFEPMPKMFFNDSLKNFRISNLQQKIDNFNELKVDFIVIKKFDKAFSKTKSILFIKKIIGHKLKPRFIFVSNNFRFGNKREGDVKELIKYEKQYNYRIIKPQPALIKKRVISSSLIRKYLQNGKLKEANKLLKKNWSIVGKVQKGKQLGKKLVFQQLILILKIIFWQNQEFMQFKLKNKKVQKILKV